MEGVEKLDGNEEFEEKEKDAEDIEAKSRNDDEENISIVEETSPNIAEGTSPNIGEETSPNIVEETSPNIVEETGPNIEETSPNIFEETSPNIEETSPNISEETSPKGERDGRDVRAARGRLVRQVDVFHSGTLFVSYRSSMSISLETSDFRRIFNINIFGDFNNLDIVRQVATFDSEEIRFLPPPSSSSDCNQAVFPNSPSNSNQVIFTEGNTYRSLTGLHCFQRL